MTRVCEHCGLLQPHHARGFCHSCNAKRNHYGATPRDWRRCGRCGVPVYGSYVYVWGTVLCDRCVEEANLDDMTIVDDAGDMLKTHNWFGITGGNETAETVKAAYLRKYQAEPEHVFLSGSVWFAGPVSAKLDLRRYLHYGVETTGGDDEHSH